MAGAVSSVMPDTGRKEALPLAGFWVRRQRTKAGSQGKVQRPNSLLATARLRGRSQRVCMVMMGIHSSAKTIRRNARRTNRRSSRAKPALACRSKGSESTHWRTGTGGKRRSTRCAAVFYIRRPQHEGPKSRPLPEKGSNRL